MKLPRYSKDELKKKMKKKHIMINTRYSMQPGDCILYENDCTCGKKFGGWTEKEADDNFSKHLNDALTEENDK